MRKAVYTSIDGTLLRRTQMERLHIFPGYEIPDDIKANITGQIRPQRSAPKRLQEYTQEEIEAFPKLFDYPKDHILT